MNIRTPLSICIIVCATSNASRILASVSITEIAPAATATIIVQASKLNFALSTFKFIAAMAN